MTLEEAVAQQPGWVGYWLYWLLFGAFILPFALLFWRQSRIAGAAAVAAAVVAGFGVGWLCDRMGYVKLLGLPHIVVWTPLAIYLVVLLRRGDLPVWLNGAEPGWPGGHVQHM
jgi:hypothetical protein